MGILTSGKMLYGIIFLFRYKGPPSYLNYYISERLICYQYLYYHSFYFIIYVLLLFYYSYPNFSPFVLLFPAHPSILKSETIKPGTVKRPELDPKRGHPNSWDSETNFTSTTEKLQDIVYLYYYFFHYSYITHFISIFVFLFFLFSLLHLTG